MCIIIFWIFVYYECGSEGYTMNVGVKEGVSPPQTGGRIPLLFLAGLIVYDN